MLLRVLLFEDNPGDARLIREMLGRENDTEIVWVERLSTGLEHLGRETFDAAILDLGLPDATGRSPVLVVQERAPGLPIVVLTGSDDDTLAIQTVRFGAQDYLVKGRVDRIGLRRTITRAIEMKRTHEALRQSEERLRTVVQNMPVMLDAFDAVGVIVAWNRECERVTGYAADEVVGNPLSMELLYPDPDYRKRVFDYYAGGTSDPATQEWELRAKDGTRRIVAWTTIAKRCPIPGWSVWAVGTDVTHLRETEQALRESERRHRQLLDLAQEGIWAIDAEARTTFVNPRMAEMLGTSVESMRNRLLFDFVDENARRQAREDLDRRRQGIAEQHEFTFRRANGHPLHALVSTNPITDETGRFIGAMAVVSDLTENRRLQDDLLQAQKMESIGRLAAGIAHEINTPTQFVSDNVSFLADALKDLDGIVTRAQQMAETNGACPQSIELLNAIKKADLPYLQEELPKSLAQAREGLDRIAKIVRAMKEFSHPGSVEKKPTDINRAIQTTLTVARNEWKYVAEAKLDLDPNLPPVPCLPGELNQVILNLLVNAAHAIGDVVGTGLGRKGTITLCTRHDGAWAEIRIVDTGTGMPPHVRQRIFEPFFTTKPQGKGTGQGLALAWNVIVKKHGGTIDVQTEEGKGTEFVLRLPLKMTGEDVAAAEAGL
jgi:PAS domain S-box-containing protein